jgi:hypothetical protein
MSHHTVFLTGDRAQQPLPAAQIVAIVINKVLVEHPEGVRFATGNCESGIERAVRYLVPPSALDVVAYDIDTEGRTQFDAALKTAASTIDEAIVIHVDPLNSRLAKAVVANFKNVEFPLDGVFNSAPDTIEGLVPPEDEEGKGTN